MKTAIIGAGAMGCLFGARLALTGNDVTMIDVVPAVIDTISRNGILLEFEGDREAAPARAARSEDVQEHFDLVILFTKTLYSLSALKAAEHFLKDDTYVLSLQNGLGNDELIEQFVSRDHVMVGVTNFPSDLIEPGHVRAHAGGYVKFMSADGQDREILHRVNEMFLHAGMDSSIVPDIQTAIWEKAGLNAAINAVCAVCLVPCGGVGRVPDGVTLTRHIAHEAAEVAHAWGIPADEGRINQGIESAAIVDDADHYPSMAQDVLKKRKSEIDHIDGMIVEYARRKNIAVPYTETLVTLMHIIEANYPQSANGSDGRG